MGIMVYSVLWVMQGVISSTELYEVEALDPES